MSPCMWTAQDLQPRLGVIWKELNPYSTTLIEQINKNIQSPKIHVFDIHPTCTLVPGEGEGAHPLSALAHGKSDTLPCCDRPHAFYHSLYVFFLGSSLWNIPFPCGVSAVWPAGGEWWEWLWSHQDRFHARSSLSAQLLPAAVRHGLFATTAPSIQGRLWRAKPPQLTLYSVPIVC